jgi:hypothetical protein
MKKIDIFKEIVNYQNFCIHRGHELITARGFEFNHTDFNITERLDGILSVLYDEDKVTVIFKNELYNCPTDIVLTLIKSELEKTSGEWETYIYETKILYKTNT